MEHSLTVVQVETLGTQKVRYFYAKCSCTWESTNTTEPSLLPERWQNHLYHVAHPTEGEYKG